MCKEACLVCEILIHDSYQPSPVVHAAFSDQPGLNANAFYPFFSMLREVAVKERKPKLGTRINPSTPNLIVPRSFSRGEVTKRGLCIYNIGLFKKAFDVARELKILYEGRKHRKEAKSKNIRKRFRKQHGNRYVPSLLETHSQHFYPKVVLTNGKVFFARLNNTATGPFNAEIAVVDDTYSDYAEVGLDFIIKNKCSFCFYHSPKANATQCCFHVGNYPEKCPWGSK